MNVVITLDYELFFGSQSGSAENCIINPTKQLLKVLNTVKAKATFFVDVGYLSRAEELACDQDSVDKVKTQIQELVSAGHDIQLHIHPHWENTEWENGKWHFDLSYYKLSNFSEEEAKLIVQKYSDKLHDIIGKRAIAYRAGGWCIQPFEHFGQALFDAGIRLDSTVYKDGKNVSETQGFDFTNSPRLPWWKFDLDPMVPSQEGQFIELPISSSRVSPLFYWKFAFMKKLAGQEHKNFGDGSAARMSSAQLKRLLLKGGRTVASIDGYKSSLLEKFKRDAIKEFGTGANLVLIGHPKSLTPYSLKQLGSYLERNRADNYMTISQWYSAL